jgi:hypothetical protein
MSYTLEITYISDNEDGSANVELEMSEAVKHKLIEEGLHFLLIKAILGKKTEDFLESQYDR